MIEPFKLLEVMPEDLPLVTKLFTLPELQVDNWKSQVVVEGSDKAIPVVNGMTKLRNDHLTER